MKKILLIFLVIFAIININTSTQASASTGIIVEQCNAGVCTPLVQKNNQQILTNAFLVGSTLTLNISALNPQQIPIYSTQTWITYDPNIFEILNVSGDTSDFPLAAPGEMNAIPAEKIIKIGRAVAGLPITTTKANIVQIELKIIKNPAGAILSFYDYRKSDVGKTSLLTLKNYLPENILTSKPKNIVFTSIKSAPTQNQNPTDIIGNTLGTNSQGSTSLPQNTNSGGIYGTTNPYAINDSNNASNRGNTNSVDILRPKGLRSRTYADGRIEHLWQMGEDSRIKGYYLYYSTASGRYMHRRDIGRTNSYRFPAHFFEKGKRVYFAVQAYDTSGKTSDFSDETYLVIGHSGSESHPFFEQIFPNIDPKDALIVRDKNGKIIYKGSRNKYKASLTTAKKYPKPGNTPSSGFSNNLLLLFGGVVFLIAGAYYYRKKSQELLFITQNITSQPLRKTSWA